MLNFFLFIGAITMYKTMIQRIKHLTQFLNSLQTPVLLWGVDMDKSSINNSVNLRIYTSENKTTGCIVCSIN